MLDLVISGGQSGADQGAWRAARAAGVPTGGWMPLGFLTEGGPRPEFAGLYGAREMPTADYQARTERNVRDSDATLWFGSTNTPGAWPTLNAVRGVGRPSLLVIPRREVRPSDVAGWITRRGFRTLNVAGHREGKSPGTGARVERFMADVFCQLWPAGRPGLAADPPGDED
jgi:hypothetical protein